MRFDYSSYMNGCLEFPAFVALITIPGIISLLKQLWVMWRNQEMNEDSLKKIIFCGIICCFCCALSVGPLLNGGLYLLIEDETDAIEIQGEITQIVELNRYVFPHLKNDYESNSKYGVQIVVSGTKCIAISGGTLEVGDYVTVRYLPRSGYVLYISNESYEDGSSIERAQ